MLKDPAAVLDYQWDWSEWLAEGETISEATVTAPEGITKDEVVTAGTAVTVWLSGGTAGLSYRLDCLISTTGGARTAGT
jgi:hypothetical protein